MRIFIAIDLPPEIKDSVSRLIAKLKEASAAVKWTSPENLHFTLKFIGEIKEVKLKEVKEILAETVSGLKPFSVSLEGIGTFPSGKSPRVIWIGAKEGADQICKIMRELNERYAAEDIADKEDREPLAHLTLGRVKEVKGLDKLVQLIEKHKSDNFGKAAVREIGIIKSQLTRKGPVYTKVESVRLV